MFKRVGWYGCVVALLSGSVVACGDAGEPERAAAEQSTALVASRNATLVAVEDSRTQSPSADRNFGNGLLWTNTDGHYSFVKFDLTALPAGAVIESAELRFGFTGNYPGDNDVELGRVDGPWQESTLTWNNQPGITWSGRSQTVGDAPGDVVYDVSAFLAKVTTPEISFALRSVTPGGKQYYSRESGPALAPRLVVVYRTAPVGPVTDVGDAPDSSNGYGINNTAYAATGVLGQFPTVWNVPIGQAAGPRHANQTLQGFLGENISRELEAHSGPDQDGLNNILRNAAGMLGDNSNQDFADDTWQNGSTAFFNCTRRNLEVRVSRPLGANLPVMYLNVWFDGTRNGNWQDVAPCVPPGGGAPVPSTEWLVQNEPINMNAIAPGTFADINVLTERILNVTPGLAHWMRFTLSEAPAPQVGNMADGRGPHPSVAPQGYLFGETEDYLQLPPPPAAFGELELSKSATPATPEPIANNSFVEYTLRLKHKHGSEPVPARLRDHLPSGVLPVPLPSPTVSVDTQGGVNTGFLGWSLEPPAPGSNQPTFQLDWEGVMAPDSELTLRFFALTSADCGAFQAEKQVVNTAEAESAVHGPLSAAAAVRVDCPFDLAHDELDPSAVDAGALR